MERFPAGLPMLLVLCSRMAACDPATDEFHLPGDFKITQFSDRTLAPDIYSMTVGPEGRIIVSGRGYIRILEDKSGDGVADQAFSFAEEPSDGAMGLYWEDDSLYFTGDGGLRVLRDADGDSRADGPSHLIREFVTGDEHSAHAVRRGPDGWLYVMCGNMTGIDSTFADLDSSPVSHPVAGCVLRFDPDLENCEILADGFRNPYDFDFNQKGDLFVYDADNERCQSLPWYEYTRFYHVLPGGHYGWQDPQRARTWRMPPYFFDVVPPIATLGRGSPTGVECYDHTAFPPEFRDGFFLADWTFGKIYFLSLEKKGAEYQGDPKIFLETVGASGFAPTDLVVHPKTGDLFISIGGRGTRGAVYRVQFIGNENGLSAAPGSPGELGIKADASANSENNPREEFRISGDPEFTEAVELCDRQPGRAAKIAKAILEDRTRQISSRLNAVRLIQILIGDLMSPDAMGTVWEGYSRRWKSCIPQSEEEILDSARSLFPTGDRFLDREISRLFALAEDDHMETPEKVLNRISPDTPPDEDIHYLIVYSKLRGNPPTDLTGRVASAFLALDRKTDDRGWRRERNWFSRLRELHQRLAEKDPMLPDAIRSHPEFGRKSHLLVFGDPISESQTAVANPDGNAPGPAPTRRPVSHLSKETLESWRKRFSGIDWNRGNPESGGKVYETVGCGGCHTGGRALGPSLEGAARRFSREDLFTAILDPSRDIPDDYQSLIVDTVDGEQVQGMVVYKALDSLLLQIDADTTLRFTGDQIAGERPSTISQMPGNLLDALNDQEIADLYAYLRSLEVKENAHLTPPASPSSRSSDPDSDTESPPPGVPRQ